MPSYQEGRYFYNICKSINSAERAKEQEKLTGKHSFVRHAILIANIRSNQQSQQILGGGIFSPVHFFLDEDLLPLLNDLHPHLVHDGFSTVPSLINSKRLVPDSNQGVSVKKTDDPEGRAKELTIDIIHGAMLPINGIMVD